jgi:hypothetical protein
MTPDARASPPKRRCTVSPRFGVVPTRLAWSTPKVWRWSRGGGKDEQTKQSERIHGLRALYRHIRLRVPLYGRARVRRRPQRQPVVLGRRRAAGAPGRPADGHEGHEERAQHLRRFTNNRGTKRQAGRLLFRQQHHVQLHVCRLRGLKKFPNRVVEKHPWQLRLPFYFTTIWCFRKFYFI